MYPVAIGLDGGLDAMAFAIAFFDMRVPGRISYQEPISRNLGS